MNVEAVREKIPAVCQEAFDAIVSGRALGASNHIKMIFDMYIAIAREKPKAEAQEAIGAVGAFFKRTRGESSYAIVSALRQMEQRIAEQTDALPFAEAVEQAVRQYFADADEHLKNILRYTDRLLKDTRCVLLYDYSSTVEKAIAACSHPLYVYIAESRVIDGGYPFVKGLIEAGHQVHFIPDASLRSVLDEVEMVFIGAETFYPDGTAFNTVGSDVLAELCLLHHVPYYVLTPLLKHDIRAMYGIYKPVLKKDLRAVLARNWPDDLRERADFTSIELVGVEPKYITGYVTEKGILPPDHLLPFVYEEGAYVE